MSNFKIELFKGHPIIESDKDRILIDTGAPATIHISDTLHFCSDNHSCSRNYMGLTVQKISDLLGTEITTLLGTDILSKYKILFDYRNESIVFDKNEIPFNGKEMSLSGFMGIPVIELVIDCQNLKFFLDTGARLSYLSKDITENYKVIGTEEDFYPGVGMFQTECCEIPTRLNQCEFKVRYGNLPPLLQMTLTLGGTNGIIGFDFFNHFRVFLDIENGIFKYESY
jgi:hypothetical protein